MLCTFIFLYLQRIDDCFLSMIQVNRSFCVLFFPFDTDIFTSICFLWRMYCAVFWGVMLVSYFFLFQIYSTIVSLIYGRKPAFFQSPPPISLRCFWFSVSLNCRNQVLRDILSFSHVLWFVCIVNFLASLMLEKITVLVLFSCESGCRQLMFCPLLLQFLAFFQFSCFWFDSVAFSTIYCRQ